MKKLYLLVFSLLITTLFANAQFTLQSQKCFGDTSDEGANKIITTRDGGYIFAGWANANGDDVSGNHGGQDAWVVKVNSSNTIEWQRCVGGTDFEVAYDIKQTPDGGFLVTGQSGSNDGDFTEDNRGSLDAFVVKLDSTGDIIWANTYGGSNDEGGYRIFPMPGGKCIMIGYTYSDDQEIDENHVGRAWVLELDTQGNIVWSKTYGGSQDDEFDGMVTDDAGNYIFAGSTSSNDGNVTGGHGDHDLWLVKTDTIGTLLAQKCFGGTDDDYGNNLLALSSGNLVITGLTYSNNGDVIGNHGSGDAWAVKTDAAFNLKWQKCIGGSQYDELIHEVLLNGNIVSAGITESLDGDFTGLNHGTQLTDDIALISLDTSGSVLIKKCYGGTGYDEGWGITVKNADVYVCGTTSANDGDVSGNHGGFEDAWVLHLSTANAVDNIAAFVQTGVFPNPSTGNFQLNINAVHQMNAVLTITNLLGESVLNQTINVHEGNNTFIINKNNQAKGVYFLHITSGENAVTQKIIFN